jgi:hypothetical protein
VAVLVADKPMQPALPCSEKRARFALERGRAGVHHLYPFEVEPARIRIETTGIAVTREEDDDEGTAILQLGEYARAGRQFGGALTARRASRHRRHNENLRDRIFNTEKSARPVEEFPGHDAKRLAAIWPQLKAPPRDAGAVNGGIHVGRLKVRATGWLTVGKADGIKARRCTRLHHADGSGHGRRPAIPSAIELAGFQRKVCV